MDYEVSFKPRAERALQQLVYTINDGELLVLVVRLGHRRDIYKN